LATCGFAEYLRENIHPKNGESSGESDLQFQAELAYFVKALADPGRPHNFCHPMMPWSIDIFQ